MLVSIIVVHHPCKTVLVILFYHAVAGVVEEGYHLFSFSFPGYHREEVGPLRIKIVFR